MDDSLFSSLEFSRIRLLLGKKNLLKLQQSRIAIFGLGAVGSFALECLARCGIGYFKLVDFDEIRASNLNRHLFALHSTIGKSKTELSALRIKDINPNIIVETHQELFRSVFASQILDTPLDFVVDAIDSVNPKAGLIIEATKRNIPVITAMGAAAKLNPSRVRCSDISEVYGCHLCHHVRRRLRKAGIKNGITAVWSDEAAQEPLEPISEEMQENTFKQGRVRLPLPSVIFVPATVGIMVAHHVIASLLNLPASTLSPPPYGRK